MCKFDGTKMENVGQISLNEKLMFQWYKKCKKNCKMYMDHGQCLHHNSVWQDKNFCPSLISPEYFHKHVHSAIETLYVHLLTTKHEELLTCINVSLGIFAPGEDS